MKHTTGSSRLCVHQPENAETPRYNGLLNWSNSSCTAVDGPSLLNPTIRLWQSEKNSWFLKRFPHTGTFLHLGNLRGGPI